MTKYFDLEGDYMTACDALLEGGGQLFTSGGKHGPHTLVRGSNIYTYWPKNSLSRGQLIEACKALDINPEGMTGGRLCRLILKDIVGLKHKGTFFSDRHKALAKDGYHWHYTKLIPGQHGNCLEFDIKSAYFSSLFRFPSLLLSNSGKFVSDDGAMENLKALNPLLPKWLRLQLLGVLSAHERRYFVVKDDGKGKRMKMVVQHEIAYGQAFNTAHESILNLYKLMQRIDLIAGDYCVRMHTDSFTLKSDLPLEVFDEICELIVNFGSDLWLKKQGHCTFFDLNTGLIGKQCIGAKIACLDELKDSGLEHDFNNDWVKQPKFWRMLLAEYEKEIESLKPAPVPLPKQMLITGFPLILR